MTSIWRPSVDSSFNSAALAYAFGPQVRWNIFNGGRISNAGSCRERAHGAVLEPLRTNSVAGGPGNRIGHGRLCAGNPTNEKLKEAVNAAERSVEQSQVLYKSGLSDFQSLLDMERDLFQQQNLQAVSEGTITQDIIAIYRALGGGWDDGTLTPRTASAAVPAQSSQP